MSEPDRTRPGAGWKKASDHAPDGLPPGVPRGQDLNSTVEQDQLTSGGVGPGSEGPGPQALSMELQKGHAPQAPTEGHEGVPRTKGEG